MLKYRKTTKLYKIYNIGTMHIFKYDQQINTLSLYNKKIKLENWRRIYLLRKMSKNKKYI